MTHQIRMWEVADGSTPTEVRRDEISLEERLQDWLEEDISILDPDLLVIGREVPTDYGGKIDLLCLDSTGGLVIVELKKGRTPREVTAQVLDYAYWVRDLSYEKISALFDDYRKSRRALSEAFEQKYGDELPATLNESHRSVIVAEEMDGGTERIVRYLSDLDVPINVATVQHFKTKDGREMLAQVYLIEPEAAADTAQTASRKTTYQNVRERQALADERGVGDLYRLFKEKASGRLSTSSMGPGNVALNVRVENGTRTILAMHVGESDQVSGLKFRLNATRLMNHFGLSERQIREGLPESAQAMPDSEWRGASTDNAEDWKGFKGHFCDVDEIERFMAILRPQPQRSNE
ncbi:MAG: endonuclease NucS [Gammaproteobacteria bacterium]|nr:endonuclease NucS [Gammaproteobacteria bacterium]